MALRRPVDDHDPSHGTAVYTAVPHPILNGEAPPTTPTLMGSIPLVAHRRFSTLISLTIKAFIILVTGIFLGIASFMLPTLTGSHPHRVTKRRSSTSQCERTTVFPMQLGCPIDCVSSRGRTAGPFFTLTVEWNFGKLKPIRSEHQELPNLVQGGSSNTRFVDRFLRLESDLTAHVKRSTEAVVRKLQKDLHISLAYLCCLTGDEERMASQGILRWHNSTKTNIELTLDGVRCYHIRPDFVTVVWELGESSETKLHDINEDLANYVRTLGIPVLISHKDQLPFHSTIVGFTTADAQPVDPYLDHVCSVVRRTKRLRANAEIEFALKVHTHPST